MVHKLALAALAVPVVGVGLLASADYAIVDVREKRAGGHHFVVPVPLALARMALRFAPDEARAVELPPEAIEHLPLASRALDVLAPLPDFDLVQVEEPGQRVLVRKAGDKLVVDVHGRRDEDVHVELPIEAARDLLRTLDGGRVEPAQLIAALGDAKGRLVHVNDRDAEVSVRIW
jgi:hypothetical protein